MESKALILLVADLIDKISDTPDVFFDHEVSDKVHLYGWVNFGRDWELQLAIYDPEFTIGEDELWELAQAIRTNQDFLFEPFWVDLDAVSMQVNIGNTFHGFPEQYLENVLQQFQMGPQGEDITEDPEGVWLTMQITDYAS